MTMAETTTHPDLDEIDQRVWTDRWEPMIAMPQWWTDRIHELTAELRQARNLTAGWQQGPYRTGTKLGRTVYQDDQLIGVMDTPELGALVVDALNRQASTDA